MKKLLGLVVVLFFSVWPAAATAQDCTLATVRGTYTYTFEARDSHGKVYSAALGSITFDGSGHFAHTFTHNLGQGAVTMSAPGLYTVSQAEDGTCTYTGEFPDLPFVASEQRSHTFGIIAQRGKKLLTLNTDPGNILVFTAEKEE